MRVNVIADHRSIQGSYMNLIDFQQYLREVENVEVHFFTNDKDELQRVLKKSMRSYKFDEIIPFKDIIISAKYPVVTDFKTLCSTYKTKKRIFTNKMVVFDNLELSLFLNDGFDAYFHPNVTMDEILEWHKYSEILFLMPKCNKEVFEKKYPHLPCQEFYKKLYVPKVDEIEVGDNGRNFYRVNNYYDLPQIDGINIDDEIKKVYPNADGLSIHDGIKAFEYSGYIYTKKQETNYWEQFGRTIFEFLVLGKEILWYDDPFQYKDGLRDYLIHYSDDGKIIREMMSEPYQEKFWK